jgi:hypothetical protein
VVPGNAGTLLDVALPDPFPSATVHPDPAGNATVSTIANSAGFGFLLMEYTGAVWTITEYRLDGTVRSVCTAQLTGQSTAPGAVASAPRSPRSGTPRTRSSTTYRRSTGTT